MDPTDPLADTAAPRYAIESDEEEDEPNPLRTSIAAPAKVPEIKIIGLDESAHGRPLIIASGRAGAFWARGADLGEQQGGVYVDKIQVGLLFIPASLSPSSSSSPAPLVLISSPFSPSPSPSNTPTPPSSSPPCDPPASRSSTPTAPPPTPPKRQATSMMHLCGLSRFRLGRTRIGKWKGPKGGRRGWTYTPSPHRTSSNRQRLRSSSRFKSPPSPPHPLHHQQQTHHQQPYSSPPFNTPPRLQKLSFHPLPLPPSSLVLPRNTKTTRIPGPLSSCPPSLEACSSSSGSLGRMRSGKSVHKEGRGRGHPWWLRGGVRLGRGGCTC
ncbi:hypothetical protein FA13DRAFT_1741598, partial [Coprinellus micaceus]